MNKVFLFLCISAVTTATHAYTIKYSYKGENNATEYFGACDGGENLKVVELGDDRYAFEGPAGSGEIRGQYGLDKAAAAACGE